MASGSSIIANLSANLTNTYSYLASLYPEEGVTYKNITEARVPDQYLYDQVISYC